MCMMMTAEEFRLHLLTRRVEALERSMIKLQIWMRNSYLAVMAAIGFSAGLILSTKSPAPAPPVEVPEISRYENITLWGFL